MAALPAAKKVEVTPRFPVPPTTTRPRGPTIKVRRYGQNDYDKFDEENARGSFLPVGSASVGKVDIECKYRWRESQWGILGPQNPGGIVYMDIVFHQPDGYWLKNATVWITMGEDEKSTYARGSPKKRLGTDEYAVQISEHFGPKILTGGKASRTETKTTSFNPRVTVPNVADIEGFSRTSEHTQERSKSWKFSGNVGRPRGCAGFRTLKWELVENDFDPDQPHSQEYRTAFAFEHSQRPVYMRVEMEGNLGRKSKRVLQNFKHFSSRFGNKDKFTLTYIDFSKGPMSTDPLDKLARSLKMAMELENYKNVPVVVPDPAPAEFFPDDDWAGNSPPQAESKQGTAVDVDPLVRELKRLLEDRTPSRADRLGLSVPNEYAESLVTTEDNDDADDDDDTDDATTLVNGGSTAADTAKPDISDKKAQSEDAERLRRNVVFSFFLGLFSGISQLFALASVFSGLLMPGPPEKEDTKKGRDATSKPPQKPAKSQKRRSELLSGALHHDADLPLLIPPGDARAAELCRTATDKKLPRRSLNGHALPRRPGGRAS